MLWMAVQVAPDSSQEIASVVRFARAAFNAGITLEEVIDENDRGLDEALMAQFGIHPKMVRCMATPIVANGDTQELRGVLVVWGAPAGYGPSDTQILKTLAVLCNHLLTTARRGAAERKVSGMIAEEVRMLRGQRESMARVARQVCASAPVMLHKVAHQLAECLNCASVTLWLVETTPTKQLLVTHLDPKRERDEEEDENSYEDGTVATNGYARAVGDVVSIPLGAQGIVGAVLGTAKPLNIGDAHIHHAYKAEVDEAVQKLEPGHTALMAVPLCDYHGRVMGVLQASGKLDTPSDGVEVDNLDFLLEEYQKKVETPTFTEGDFEFLIFLADRMGNQLQYLDLSGHSASDIVQQQNLSADLQAQAEKQLQTLLDNRRQLASLGHDLYAAALPHSAPSGYASHGASGALGGKLRPSSLAPPSIALPTPTPLPSASLQRVPSKATIGFPAKKKKVGGRLDPLPDGTLGDQLDAMRARVGGTRSSAALLPEVLDTPDAVWDDLCRALREL